MNDEPQPGVTVPSASSLLARAVYTVIESDDKARIFSIGPGGAALGLPKKTTLALFFWQEDKAQEISQRLTELMKSHTGTRLVAGLVGGEDDARRLLKKAYPMMTQVKVGLLHVDARGEVWSRDAGPAAKAFRDFARTPHPSPEAWSELLISSAAAQDEIASQTQEAHQFFTALQSRRPVATWTLAGIILAVFGLELAFGGSQSTPVLLRMGALAPEKVQAGEIWRLFSCTFLHAGWLHLIFNTYVLWMIGSHLERLLGIWRFLVLYGISCLGASLVSMAFLDGFSVGASGGLWGLLGAQAVLAYRSQGLLPKAMIPGAQQAAIFNLGINVANSFRPHIDMWAHFGGGAVGGILMLSGVLTRGVPRLGELEAEGRLGGAEAATIRTGPALKSVGAGAAAALLIGLVLGLANGRAWTLKQPLISEQTAVPELGVSLKLPVGLPMTPDSAAETPSVQAGDLRADPGAVVLTRYAADLRDPAVLERERAGLLEALSQGPQGASLMSGPEEVTLAGAPGLTVTYRYANDIEEEMAFVLFEDAMFKADILRWPAFGDAVPAGYAAQVLDSLEPL